MTIQIIVPQMGESITEGVISKWLKAEGDAVAADEPVIEVETDKITVEVPAPGAGVLAKQSVAVGDTVAVGQTLGEITEGAAADRAEAEIDDEEPEAEAEKPAPKAEKPKAEKPEAETPEAETPEAETPEAEKPEAEKPEAEKPKAEKPKAEKPKAEKPKGASGSDPAAGPSARLEATRSGVDLSQVSGTARGGRITKDDVVRAAAPASRPAAAPASRRSEDREERKAMSPLRRRVAERLIEAQNNYAILTTFNEVDMSAVVALRARYKETFEKRHGVRLGFMSFFAKAAVAALREFPMVNSEIDGNDIIYKYYYDIGVAVGGGKGLVVPVIRSVDTLSFAEVEQQIAEYGAKAKANKLTMDELTGGTFTISNGGVYGSMLSTPILNPPQTAILGLHNIVERPVAIDGKVEIRPIMYLAVSYDHRLLDGREAVQFLVRIKECIEDPERMLFDV